MKILRFFLFLSLSLSLAACAMHPYVEMDESADFSRLKTFAWRTPTVEDVSDPILDSELLVKRVEAAVSTRLETDGFRKVAAAPDFFVTFHTAQKVKDDGPRVGFGFGAYRGWGGSSVLLLNSSGEYEEGILIIDIIDADGEKLIWRGWRPTRLSQDNFNQEGVQELVDIILGEFPPRR